LIGPVIFLALRKAIIVAPPLACLIPARSAMEVAEISTECLPLLFGLGAGSQMLHLLLELL
jgi:hypothetical protein